MLHEESHAKRFATSNGSDGLNSINRASCYMMMIAEDQHGQSVQLMQPLSAKGNLADLDLTLNRLEPMLAELYQHLQAKRVAVAPRGGNQTVVLSPGLAGMLAHEAMGHPCEADLVLGSSLSYSVGCYSLMAMGTASDGDKSSSFNYTGGDTHDLSAHASEYFGIANMLWETERQIDARPISDKFVGEIILAPTAISDLLGWLLGQLGDSALIADSSVFKDSVGDVIASPLLSIRSRFDAPGQVPYSNDAFVAPAIDLVVQGQLSTLLPSLYGSRKTGLPHTPSSSGWSIDTGELTRDELIGSVPKGALVNRLSMGSPGPNGDFSGVIKNSFIIKDGAVREALSDTMIAGNMAQMLKDISGVSREHVDFGGQDFPWVRI